MNWKPRKLDQCAKFLSGGTPSKSNVGYWTGDIPWVSSGEMVQSFIEDTELHLSADGALNGTRTVPKHTVLAVVRGMSLAKEFRVSITQREMTFNKDIKAFRCADDIDPHFLFYALKARKNHIRELATEASHGTKKLETDVLGSVEILVPDTVEIQKAAASIALNYDDLIENNRRRIALLEDAARQLYKEWFVRFRFPGHEHVEIINGLPEGWELTTLGAVCDTNVKSYSAKNLPEYIRYIDIAAVDKGEIVSNPPISSAEAPGRARQIASHGDVIWSNVRPNLRAYALVMHPESFDVFSTGFTILSSDHLPYSYLYYITTTDDFVAYLVNQTTGASYPAVRHGDFERAEILLPPKRLLNEFQAVCEPNFELAANLRRQGEQLAKARDFLLPRLMSGTLTV